MENCVSTKFWIKKLWKHKISIRKLWKHKSAIFLPHPERPEVTKLSPIFSQTKRYFTDIFWWFQWFSVSGKDENTRTVDPFSMVSISDLKPPFVHRRPKRPTNVQQSSMSHRLQVQRCFKHVSTPDCFRHVSDTFRSPRPQSPRLAVFLTRRGRQRVNQMTLQQSCH